MMRCHEDTMMLRNTTGSYGRPVIEVAYREILVHSTEAVLELIAREEWLGCQHDASPMSDILGQHQCGLRIYIFSDFQHIKIYVYV